MKHALLAGIGLCALAVAAPPAGAADIPAAMPVKAPAVVAPVFNWTGLYVGGHVGYGWADHSFKTSFADAATEAYWDNATTLGAYNTAPDFDSDGWLAGFQFGYNYQLGRYVLGVEADISWTDISGSQTSLIEVPPLVPSTTVATSDLDWFGTLRGRLGFLPTDRLLVYATGGLAVGRTKYSYSFAFPDSDDFVDGAGSKTRWGWTIGGGAELALGDNWTRSWNIFTTISATQSSRRLAQAIRPGKAPSMLRRIMPGISSAPA